MVILQILLIRRCPSECHVAGFLEYVHVVFERLGGCNLFVLCNSRGIMGYFGWKHG
jgi:hypothetical protein